MFTVSDELVSNNKAFDNYLKTSLYDEKIKISRIMSLVGAVVFGVYFFVDYLSVTESRLEIALVRTLAIFNILLVYKSTFHEKFFLKNYTKVMTYGFFSSGSAIVLMIYFSSETDIAYNTYFAGLMMVVVSIFPFTYINTKILLSISIALMIEYVFVFYFLKGDRSDYHLALTANNMFFIMGGLILGLIVEFLKKKHLYNLFRTEFRLKQFLLSSENESTILNISTIENAGMVLDEMLADANMCHINLCVKKLESKNKLLPRNLSSSISITIPLKHKIILVGDKTLFYAFYYEGDNISIVDAIDYQIGNLLPDKDKKSYDIETIHCSKNEVNITHILGIEIKEKTVFKDKNIVNIR